MASAHVCLATRKSKILMLSVPVAVRVVQALETHIHPRKPTGHAALRALKLRMKLAWWTWKRAGRSADTEKIKADPLVHTAEAYSTVCRTTSLFRCVPEPRTSDWTQCAYISLSLLDSISLTCRLQLTYLTFWSTNVRVSCKLLHPNDPICFSPVEIMSN